MAFDEAPLIVRLAPVTIFVGGVFAGVLLGSSFTWILLLGGRW